MTLDQLHEDGWTTQQVFSLISESMGIEADNSADFLEQFRLDKVGRQPWVFDPSSP